VGDPIAAPPIPSGFIGFSTEYNAIEPYAGADPGGLSPVFVRLIENLTRGQPTSLRIGGDSADHTWWPVPGMTRPPGVTYSLDQRWLAVTRAVAAAVRAKLILGINLEADSLQLASAEANALVNGLGPANVLALELGNEPELYDSFAWYRVHHHAVTGRPRDHYTLPAFLEDFTLFSSVMPHVPIAGPTIGGPGWLKHLSEILDDEPRLGLVTVHRYPLQSCFARPGSKAYPTIPRLLAPAASTGLADGFAPMVAIARARGLPIRIDELNSVSCGADPSVSHTFGSALWVMEAMFEMARVGVGAVNVHTFPGAGYELFKLARGRASVAPEYYGLLLFSQAAPPGARLLSVSGVSGLSGPSGVSAGGAPVRAWATRAPGGRVSVALVDADPSRSTVVALRVPGARGDATVARLTGPSLGAASGVSLGGRWVGSSGTFVGRRRALSISPQGGRYVVWVPAASAAVVTFGSTAPSRG
jgi:hypothetical protein